MYYELEGLGRYDNLYSADFAAITHCRAYYKRVIGYAYEESDPDRFIAVRFYFPSGKIITQYAFSNTVLK